MELLGHMDRLRLDGTGEVRFDLRKEFEMFSYPVRSVMAFLVLAALLATGCATSKSQRKSDSNSNGHAGHSH